jgi:tetratricopeptide (TPR) repeat protein
MRSFMIGLVLMLPASLQAGVYNLAEYHPQVTVAESRKQVLSMRSGSVPPREGVTLNPEHFRYQLQQQIATLEAARANGTLGLMDRINLSGAYLRFGTPKEVIRLLNRQDSHFLLQANLAAAYFLEGELSLAVSHQQQALALWPEVMAGWNEQQLQFNRECERYVLRLYERRREEQELQRSRPNRGSIDIDSLFRGVRYIGPDGQYVAGSISRQMRDLLPYDALGIMLQLGCWYPNDMRLYWQLGEMLNAHSQVEQASQIFTELLDSGHSTFKDLADHRRVLLTALPAYRVWHERKSRGQMVSAMMALPRPTLGGVAGDVGSLTTAWAVAIWAEQPPPNEFGDMAKQMLQPAGQAGPDPSLQLPFNWRHVAIGFVWGALVMLLLQLQWRAWRRQRERRQLYEAALAQTSQAEDIPEGIMNDPKQGR